MRDVVHTARVGACREVPRSLGPFWSAGIRAPATEMVAVEVRAHTDLHDVRSVGSPVAPGTHLQGERPRRP